MARGVCVSVIFVALVGICYGGTIEVLDCSGVTNRVRDVVVEVSDCETGNNCTLYKGQTYYLTTTFTPTDNFTDVNMRSLGVMGILKVPYMGHIAVCPQATSQDGENCDEDTGLLAGRTYMHVKDFPVRRRYPKINMKARVEYFIGSRSTRRTMILCYEIPVKIEEGDSYIEEELLTYTTTGYPETTGNGKTESAFNDPTVTNTTFEDMQ